MDSLIELARQSSPAAQDLAPVSDSPARTRLAVAIGDLAAAAADLAMAQERAARLGAVIAEAARLEAELASLRAAERDRLGAWLAGGGEDRRPEPPAAIAAAESRLETLAADAGAARAALPAAEQAFRLCAERVRELQRRRDEAICETAIDAASGFAADYRTALTAALEHEAVLHGLRDELLVRGNRADGPATAPHAAARIGELIAETRRAAAARRDGEAGRRLLAALVCDPEARL